MLLPVADYPADHIIIFDNHICFIEIVPVSCNETAFYTEVGISYIQLEGYPKWPEPEKHSGHIFISPDGNDFFDRCVHSSLQRTWQPVSGWFITHKEKSPKTKVANKMGRMIPWNDEDIFLREKSREKANPTSTKIC